MEARKLISYLEKVLNDAKQDMLEFKTSNADIDNKGILRKFTSNILTLLDYSFNDYPNNNNDYYYPRPKHNQKEINYINSIRCLKTTKRIKITNSLYNFLVYGFKINRNYNQAISLLQSGAKHKIDKNPENITQTKLKYALTTTTGKNPIQKNSNGGIDIAKAIHAEKGAHVYIHGGIIETSDGITEISELEFSPINKGAIKLYGVETDAVLWMSNCISICEQLIQRIKENFK